MMRKDKEFRLSISKNNGNQSTGKITWKSVGMETLVTSAWN